MAAGIDARVFVMKRAAASAPAEWARMAYGLCTRLATTCARSAAWCSGLYAGGDTCSLSPWPRRARSTQRKSRSSLRGFEGGRLEILSPTFPRSTSRRAACSPIPRRVSASVAFRIGRDAFCIDLRRRPRRWGASVSTFGPATLPFATRGFGQPSQAVERATLPGIRFAVLARRTQVANGRSLNDRM